MSSFESATLWQNSLAKKTNDDEFEKEREFFRTSLENFRKKALILAGEIAIDMPDYTVHDITHIDALWEMASIICGEDYELNPAEAYILGGAFLIHDLGMGLAAYPDGIENIKKTTIWEDKYAYMSKNFQGSQEMLDKSTMEVVLRALHAKQAEKLALVSWGRDSEKEYLIDDASLRDDYGSIIGKIAYSHWWDSSEIVLKFPTKLGAIGSMPYAWQIDTVKLACIMRVADASHIDSRRAPAFLRKLRKLPKLSEQHWLFQQKLYQPRIERDRLVYTSKSSFNVNEAASWWLCYDTLKMIDKELNAVDIILHNSGNKRFKAKGLANVDNLHSLMRLITTNGWTPVDARVHVGNVSGLVKNLGGSQLYGKNPLVAIRELVQNGCDAIRARRILEGDDEGYGTITIKLDKDDLGAYVEVEDDGVGMSSSVLTGPFLDFGNSFWGTTHMHDQFPGLESKGYKSTGKFGVGFFSVFMISNKVNVFTRRYEEGRSETKVLSFENELLERPILRSATSEEYIKNGGTRIRAYINDEDLLKKLFRKRNGGYFNNLSDLLIHHFPAIDVSMVVNDKIHNISKKIISANDWTYLNDSNFLERVLSKTEDDDIDGYEKSFQKDMSLLEKYKNNIREIVYEGQIVGRGYLVPGESYISSIGLLNASVTVGGFRTSNIRGCVGVFLGVTNKASRDSALPAFPAMLYRNWLSEQFELIKNDITYKQQLKLSAQLRLAGIGIEEMVFCRSSTKYHNMESLIDEIFNKYDEVKFLDSFQSRSENPNLSDDYYSVIYDDNVINVSSALEMIITQTDPEYLGWPNEEKVDLFKHSLFGLFLELAAKTWEVPLDKIKEFKISRSKNSELSRVGVYLGKEFKLQTHVLRRKDYI